MSEMNERLEELADVARLRHDVDVIERDRIAAARAAGASWDRIAAVLGIRSRQGAEQRYARLKEAVDKKPRQN
ncbi:hypothetical protein ACFXKD_13720 [Nocardiopsis aegyptia]|uniref:hypothetical protein n=1 Tax=Nocardiopsis aegyptia TaxID=220378 RepID=UPI003670B176